MALNYKFGKREMSMIETILEKDLPNEFHISYEVIGVDNIQRNFFQKVDEKRTKWISELEFEFNTFGMKMMGKFAPGMFKKQSMRYWKDFKAFAGTGASVVKYVIGIV